MENPAGLVVVWETTWCLSGGADRRQKQWDGVSVVHLPAMRRLYELKQASCYLPFSLLNVLIWSSCSKVDIWDLCNRCHKDKIPPSGFRKRNKEKYPPPLLYCVANAFVRAVTHLSELQMKLLTYRLLLPLQKEKLKIILVVNLSKCHTFMSSEHRISTIVFSTRLQWNEYHLHLLCPFPDLHVCAHHPCFQ